MERLSERFREKLRDLWHHRPIVVTYVNFENQQLDGYCDGFQRGLSHQRATPDPSNVVAITTRRTTSTGVTLRSVAGGAA